MTREQLDAIRTTEATFEEIDALIAMARRALELEEALNYVANLRSAYWIRLQNDHGWRLVETDCGAMDIQGEGATPLEAIQNARRVYAE